MQICRRCWAIKINMHVHHCVQCDTCVLNMDHHCPFTMNCAGLYNYFHFFLFICYGMSGLVYASVVSYPVFNQCWLLLDDSTCPLQSSTSLLFAPTACLALSAAGLVSNLTTWTVKLHFIHGSTKRFSLRWLFIPCCLSPTCPLWTAWCFCGVLQCVS